MEVERLTLSEWGDALPETGYEVFHTPAALSAIDAHVDGELVLYGGFKGHQAVGLMPIVETRRTIGRTLMSPPPGMNIPRLGPIVMPTSPKQRKRERVNKKFVEAVLEDLGAMGPLSLVRMLTPRQYGDPRPFQWADFKLSTQFTYVVNLDQQGVDQVLSSFSKSLRRDIRRGNESDITVSVEGLDSAREIFEATRTRYNDQSRGFPMTWDYVRDLFTGLGDDARAYVARTGDGEFLSGVTVLYGPETAYFWQGGTRTDHDGVSVNSLVHWRVIEDILEDSALEQVDEYDLMGANTKRLCDYKGKFAGELVPYYTIETDSTAMNLAKSAFMAVTR
ncbi:GNAT family N-acetyltransferase [Haloarcula marina]|uniref:GNAT family N-acetyltransferase n=1 Tax=Haloarcula marina TaxID=2961574 RepID=UPI0020B6DD6E|nr:GNAT family N-acetyltransferase [Halomicroarcula marina]